jgi:hypothetical protein
MGHVWTALGWQGLSLRKQQWSRQPCVRPVSAVHVTAGHNALRGSGPGQFHAFDNAVAQVGCPDRRFDRHAKPELASIAAAGAKDTADTPGTHIHIAEGALNKGGGVFRKKWQTGKPVMCISGSGALDEAYTMIVA